jgi:hypothetical protein
MSEYNIDELWELVGEHYLEHYASHTKLEILKELALLHQQLADLKKQRDYLYEHVRINVRDIDPDRNLKIEDWVKRGASDTAISKYLVKTVSPKVVKNIRTSLGIKKPKGRPKKT